MAARGLVTVFCPLTTTGAGIARKGWPTKADVINTLPLEKLRKELRRKRAD